MNVLYNFLRVESHDYLSKVVSQNALYQSSRRLSTHLKHTQIK
jgi:hypothetical protein